MINIRIKIISFDEESKMLTVAFASDTTRSSNPDDYPPVVFQVFDMFPGADKDAILKAIGRAGLYHLESIVVKEQTGDTSALEEELKALTGEIIEFTPDEVRPSATVATQFFYA
jgi:hypothetical protein